jgi:hypothetical protein
MQSTWAIYLGEKTGQVRYVRENTTPVGKEHRSGPFLSVVITSAVTTFNTGVFTAG